MNIKTDCPTTPGAPVHRSVLKNNDKRRTDEMNVAQSKRVTWQEKV
jgi:hypothetical protein